MNNYEIDSPYVELRDKSEGTSAALHPPESPQRNAVLFRKLGGTDRSRNVFVDSSLALRYSCSEVGNRVKESLSTLDQADKHDTVHTNQNSFTPRPNKINEQSQSRIMNLHYTLLIPAGHDFSTVNASLPIP